MGLRRSQRATTAVAAVRLARSSKCCGSPASDDTLEEMSTRLRSRGRCGEALRVAAASEDIEMRVLAAGHPATPPALRRLLRNDEALRVRWAPPARAAAETMAVDKNPGIRAAAAKTDATSPKVLTRLSSDSDWQVRAAAAANPRTPATLLAALTEDEDQHVRSAAAANPRIPAATLQRIGSRCDDQTGRAAAANPSCPPDTQWALARQHACHVEVAANPNCPPMLLERLALDQCVHTRSSDCPQDTHCRVSADDRYEVFAAIIANPSTPASLRSYILNNTEEDDLDLTLAQTQTSTDPQRLAVWAGHIDEYVRATAASNPHTTAETLHALYAPGEDDMVLNAVAPNPNCPQRLLADMAEKQPRAPISGCMAYQVASNPSCPPDVLRRLAGEDSGFACLVASNPACPPGTLTELAGHSSPEIRSQAVSNPTCPQPTVAALADCEENSIVLAALARRTLTHPSN